MVNFSDCYIAKVKSFFGLKSIDPPIPFDEFLQNNFKNMKSLIKNNQLIALDEQGNEIDISLLEKYIHASYEEIFRKINSNENQQESEIKNVDDDIPEKTIDLQQYIKKDVKVSSDVQKTLDRIKTIETELEKKLKHKERLTDSLKECEQSHRVTLENGIKRTNDKIEAMQKERQLLLNSINESSNQDKA